MSTMKPLREITALSEDRIDIKSEPDVLTDQDLKLCTGEFLSSESTYSGPYIGLFLPFY